MDAETSLVRYRPVAAELRTIAATYADRTAELQRLSVSYRRAVDASPGPDAVLAAARTYIMALEALVATGLRASALGGTAPTTEAG